MSSYSYKPLDHSLQSIRLIIVEDDLENAPVRIALRMVTLTNELVYDALSYTWGPEMPVEPIEVDGCMVEVRENLWRFLRHYRDVLRKRNPQLSGSLWIDALCIDQANLTEKSHQVRFMSTIYLKAQWVLIWLGAASENSALVDGAERHEFKSESGLNVHRYANVLFPYLSRPETIQYVGGHLRPVDNHDPPPAEYAGECAGVCQSLMAIFESGYWQRLWIVQEITSPSDPLSSAGTPRWRFGSFDSSQAKFLTFFV
jgi:hypothetical protein